MYKEKSNKSMRKFFVAWINNHLLIDDDIVKGVSENLTDFWWIELGAQLGLTNIKQFSSHQSAIDYAKNNNVEHLVCIAKGNDLEVDGRFLETLDSFLVEDDILVGHVLDRQQRYIELHDQIFYLNIKKLSKISDCNFSSHSETVTLTKPTRSDENHHDEYTPYWIAPSVFKDEYTNVKPGYKIINDILSNGYTIRSFDNYVRKSKFYLYPDTDDASDKLSQLIDKQHISKFYVYNTDSNNTNPKFVKKCTNEQPLTRMVTVAAGLNHLKTIHEIGYADNFELMFADYDRFSLYVMKKLYETWDGKDYEKFIRSIDTRIYNGNFVAENFGDFEKDFIQHWGSLEQWCSWWNEFRSKIKVKFERVNYLLVRQQTDQADKIHDFLDVDGNKILWLSNVYHYKPTSMFHGLIDRVRAQDYLISRIPATVHIFGDFAMPYGNPGLTKDKYIKVEKIAQNFLNQTKNN